MTENSVIGPYWYVSPRYDWWNPIQPIIQPGTPYYNQQMTTKSFVSISRDQIEKELLQKIADELGQILENDDYSPKAVEDMDGWIAEFIKTHRTPR